MSREASALYLLSIVLYIATPATAQERLGRVRVEVRHEDETLADAIVVVNGTEYRTDEAGRLTFSAPAGELTFIAFKDGFSPSTASIVVVADTELDVRIDLELQPAVEEEVTVVATTRSGRRIEDQPMRVEVLEREEIEEKMLMTPGDIVMLLNETGGLRVAATSPSLGAASVRIQGDARPLHEISLGRPAAVRGAAGRARASPDPGPWISVKSK